MAREAGGDDGGPRKPDEPPGRLDARDPSVDPRFGLTVSVPPVSYVTSAKSGWSGALLVHGDAGFVRSGEVRHEHVTVVLQRWQTPNLARPIGSAGRWTTFAPGTRLWLPGDREFGEWCGRPQAQMLFLATERVEAVLGTPWDRSGLTRWRDPRHPLPFVDHVIDAMMADLEAGYPAGPITGDALLVALLLHLDAGSGGAAAPRRGALGRRLDRVRDYIEANLARPLHLATLASLAQVGVRRFGQVFAAETGCTPRRYVLLRRVERAKTLLRDPELSVAQVAHAVGFADAGQLSRVFHQVTGELPDAYRRH